MVDQGLQPLQIKLTLQATITAQDQFNIAANYMYKLYVQGVNFHIVSLGLTVQKQTQFLCMLLTYKQ